MGETPINAGELLRRCADWLDAHKPHTYNDLCIGPLGEALTRRELDDLAEQIATDPQTIPKLADQLRASAESLNA